MQKNKIEEKLTHKKNNKTNIKRIYIKSIFLLLI